MGINFFSIRLVKERKKKGYSALEMSRFIPCNFYRYKMIEKGKAFPQAWELRRIEEVLGKTFKELSNPFNPQLSWNKAKLLNPVIKRSVFDLLENQDRLKIKFKKT